MKPSKYIPEVKAAREWLDHRESCSICNVAHRREDMCTIGSLLWHTYQTERTKNTEKENELAPCSICGKEDYKEDMKESKTKEGVVIYICWECQI